MHIGMRTNAVDALSQGMYLPKWEDYLLLSHRKSRSVISLWPRLRSDAFMYLPPGGSTRTSSATAGWFVGCWSFMSWQHLRSYHGRHRFIAMHSHGDFIVLPHCEARLPAPWSDIPLIHINPTSLCPIIIMRKSKVSISKSFVWLDQGSMVRIPRSWLKCFKKA